MAEQRERCAARRQQVLAVIQHASAPMGVAEIAARVGIHVNTVRFHLAGLAAEGMVERLLGEASGPGRPPVVYLARRGQALGEVRRYEVLAEMLLSHLAATGEAPAAEAAGRAWGAHLVARPTPLHRVTGEEAVDRLAQLLAELDFAPEVVPAGTASGAEGPEHGIRLRHCPFLELADPHRHLVCALHLGLMRGALAELRAPVTVRDLEPFAEPTACLAHLAPGPA
jgi:predicted ArsR family transcriptional regulator